MKVMETLYLNSDNPLFNIAKEYIITLGSYFEAMHVKLVITELRSYPLVYL